MDIAAILDDCIERLRRGEAIETCLARYPGREQELGALLHVAAQLHDAPRPRLSMTSRTVMQERLHGAMAGKEPLHVRRPLLGWLRLPAPPRPRFAFAYATLLLIILLSVSLTNIAVNSLPGTPLYPAKRVAEDARLALTSGAAQRAILHLERAQKRLAELERLFAEGRYDAEALAAMQNETALAFMEIARIGGERQNKLLGQFLAAVRAQRAALAAAAERQTDPVARLALETAAAVAARE
ncbi:MAG: hypothetical protein IT330_15635, partial [Anaerolineae bacterium]|nr:hypothetical protein [Anaerolineae bacterium]